MQNDLKLPKRSLYTIKVKQKSVLLQLGNLKNTKSV